MARGEAANEHDSVVVLSVGVGEAVGKSVDEPYKKITLQVPIMHVQTVIWLYTSELAPVPFIDETCMKNTL